MSAPVPAAGGGSRTGDRRRLECGTVDATRIRFVGSRSHPDPLLTRIQQALGILDVRPYASVGIKCPLIAERHRNLYMHPVLYLKEWDTCAPEIVLREAGGLVSGCRGQPLSDNEADPAQPHDVLALGRLDGSGLVDRSRAICTARAA